MANYFSNALNVSRVLLVVLLSLAQAALAAPLIEWLRKAETKSLAQAALAAPLIEWLRKAETKSLAHPVKLISVMGCKGVLKKGSSCHILS